jgi:hypothetical protein
VRRHRTVASRAAREAAMLKWALVYIVNRVLIFALVAIAINAYFQTSCGGGFSLARQVEQALQGLNDISRAFP